MAITTTNSCVHERHERYISRQPDNLSPITKAWKKGIIVNTIPWAAIALFTKKTYYNRETKGYDHECKKYVAQEVENQQLKLA